MDDTIGVRILPMDSGDGHTGQGGQGVFAARDFAPGDFIARFEGIETSVRTRMSLQFGLGRHIEPGENHPLRFLNHACEPNAAFRGLDLFAVATISENSEITLDYNAHEDELSNPFECRCGSAKCVGLVRGRAGQ